MRQKSIGVLRDECRGDAMTIELGVKAILFR
jgi:hypothetical protein